MTVESLSYLHGKDGDFLIFRSRSRLLTSVPPNCPSTNPGGRIKLPFSHEETAQLIGTARSENYSQNVHFNAESGTETVRQRCIC
jgi:hypothetical protein